MISDKISTRMTQSATVTSYHINATMTRDEAQEVQMHITDLQSCKTVIRYKIAGK